MPTRMIGPDGRDVITVPAGGTTALKALGWTIISSATETVTDADAETNAEPSTKKPTTKTSAPKRKPAQKRQTTTSARRRIPKPGDADD